MCTQLPACHECWGLCEHRTLYCEISTQAFSNGEWKGAEKPFRWCVFRLKGDCSVQSAAAVPNRFVVQTEAQYKSMPHVIKLSHLIVIPGRKFQGHPKAACCSQALFNHVLVSCEIQSRGTYRALGRWILLTNYYFRTVLMCSNIQAEDRYTHTHMHTCVSELSVVSSCFSSCFCLGRSFTGVAFIACGVFLR